MLEGLMHKMNKASVFVLVLSLQAYVDSHQLMDRMIHIQSRTHMSVYSTQMLQQLQRNSSRKADVGVYPVRASREGAEHSSHQGGLMQNTFSAEENLHIRCMDWLKFIASSRNFAPTVGDMAVLNKITNDYKTQKLQSALLSSSVQKVYNLSVPARALCNYQQLYAYMLTTLPENLVHAYKHACQLADLREAYGSSKLTSFLLEPLLAPLLMRFDQWCKATGFALGGVGVVPAGGDDARARAAHAFGSDDLFASLDAGAGWPASWLGGASATPAVRAPAVMPLSHVAGDGDVDSFTPEASPQPHAPSPAPARVGVDVGSAGLAPAYAGGAIAGYATQSPSPIPAPLGATSLIPEASPHPYAPSPTPARRTPAAAPVHVLPLRAGAVASLPPPSAPSPMSGGAEVQAGSVTPAASPQPHAPSPAPARMNQGTPVAPAGNSPFELCRVDDRGVQSGGSRGAAALVTSTSSPSPSPSLVPSSVQHSASPASSHSRVVGDGNFSPTPSAEDSSHSSTSVNSLPSPSSSSDPTRSPSPRRGSVTIQDLTRGRMLATQTETATQRQIAQSLQRASESLQRAVEYEQNGKIEEALKAQEAGCNALEQVTNLVRASLSPEPLSRDRQEDSDQKQQGNPSLDNTDSSMPQGRGKPTVPGLSLAAVSREQDLLSPGRFDISRGIAFLRQLQQEVEKGAFTDRERAACLEKLEAFRSVQLTARIKLSTRNSVYCQISNKAKDFMASGVARAAARADAFIAVRAVAHADLENYDGGARAAARADLDALNELAANVNGDVLAALEGLAGGGNIHAIALVDAASTIASARTARTALQIPRWCGSAVNPAPSDPSMSSLRALPAPVPVNTYPQNSPSPSPADSDNGEALSAAQGVLADAGGGFGASTLAHVPASHLADGSVSPVTGSPSPAFVGNAGGGTSAVVCGAYAIGADIAPAAVGTFAASRHGSVSPVTRSPSPDGADSRSSTTQANTSPSRSIHSSAFGSSPSPNASALIPALEGKIAAAVDTAPAEAHTDIESAARVATASTAPGAAPMPFGADCSDSEREDDMFRIQQLVARAAANNSAASISAANPTATLLPPLPLGGLQGVKSDGSASSAPAHTAQQALSARSAASSTAFGVHAAGFYAAPVPSRLHHLVQPDSARSSASSPQWLSDDDYDLPTEQDMHHFTRKLEQLNNN